MKIKKIIISGGGTGGHLYPALALAEELKSRFPYFEILFVGAIGRIEMKKVPAAGYKIIGLWVDGFQRKLTFKNFLFPFKLFFSLIKSLYIVLNYRPNIVIGTGGYASGPLIFVASFFRIPSLIQEQNSYPGFTNKILSNRVNVISVAFDGLERFFPKEKIVVTGNPVRKSIRNLIINQASAKLFFGHNPNKQTLVVLGGSLGAKKINKMIAEKLDWFESLDIQIIWQCGSLYFDEYKDLVKHGVSLFSFISEMDKLYASADIIISRAGAGTLSEICCVGKPTILIPSPNVAENHQLHNAIALEKLNAAIVLTEKKLVNDFEMVFTNLMKKKKQIEVIKNLKKISKPNATKEIIDLVQDLI